MGGDHLEGDVRSHADASKTLMDYGAEYGEENDNDDMLSKH